MGFRASFHYWEGDLPLGHFGFYGDGFLGVAEFEVDLAVTFFIFSLPFTEVASRAPYGDWFVSLEDSVVAELGAQQGHLAEFVDFAFWSGFGGVWICVFVDDFEFLVWPVLGGDHLVVVLDEWSHRQHRLVVEAGLETDTTRSVGNATGFLDGVRVDDDLIAVDFEGCTVPDAVFTSEPEEFDFSFAIFDCFWVCESGGSVFI